MNDISFAHRWELDMLELTQLRPPSRQRHTLSEFSLACSKTLDHLPSTSWSGLAVEE